MLFRFCLYGFLKNQRYFEPFFMLALLSKQLSFFAIGWLYTVRWLTINLLEVPSGALADRWGRRRCMLMSFSAYIASFLCFAFATDFTILVAAMIMFGVGDSFRTGTHKAMIFHWLRCQGREQDRIRVYGFTRSWSKIGSAVSAIVASVFLVVTRDYQTVFMLSVVPCAFNIINFLGYPAYLESEFRESVHHDVERKIPTSTLSGEGSKAVVLTRTHGITRQIVTTFGRAWSSLRRCPKLRTLMLESVAWEGVFHAVKDYLQPVLLIFVLSLSIDQSFEAGNLQEILSDQTQVAPIIVIVIGLVYTILYLLSARASRSASRYVERAGSADGAAGQVWFWTSGCYSFILVGAVTGFPGVIAAGFVALIVLQNVWRPILISRIDEHSDSRDGATILSIESQAQRTATMFLVPALGLAVDWASRGASLAGGWWPVGVVGLGISCAVCLQRFAGGAFRDFLGE